MSACGIDGGPCRFNCKCAACRAWLHTQYPPRKAPEVKQRGGRFRVPVKRKKPSAKRLAGCQRYLQKCHVCGKEVMAGRLAGLPFLLEVERPGPWILNSGGYVRKQTGNGSFEGLAYHGCTRELRRKASGYEDRRFKDLVNEEYERPGRHHVPSGNIET